MRLQGHHTGVQHNLMRRPASDLLTLPFFFIRANSSQNEPISVETETDTAKTATKTCQYGRFRPKGPPKQADTADSNQNSRQNRPKWAATAILLLHVALWEGKKIEEEEGRRRWEDTKKKGWKKNKGM